MKNNIPTLLLLLFFIPGFAQNSGYEFKGRSMPSVNKEKLTTAAFLSDITPELWHKLGLPYGERDTLEYRRKISYSMGYYLYPLGGYATAVDYVYVEISAICKGKLLRAESTGDELSAEQKNILKAVDPDSEIGITIKFKYKSLENNTYGNDNKIITGHLTLAVVPETEAEYPGGFKQLSSYLSENVIAKVSGKSASENIEQAVVKFTVTEEGRVVNAKLSRTSSDQQTDKLILDAISKMPNWKPAKNSKGIKVKQEYSIPFGTDGC